MEKMGIKNLTEAEEKEFYRLVWKMNGEEPDKEQDAKVKKLQINEQYYIVDNDGTITSCVWLDNNFDLRRWKLGNVFLTKQEAEFAREKQKIKTELQRFADKHNDPTKKEWDGENFHYYIVYDVIDDDLTTTTASILRHIDDVYFSSEELAEDAINEVGAERILKYLFDEIYGKNNV